MVHVLGCDHYLQEYDLRDYPEEVRKIERELKEKFYLVTEEIIRTHGIKFVGEECKPAQKTIPRALAVECCCAYVEIDMPTEEREKRGIPKDYQKLGGEEEARCHNIREDFMVERVFAESTLESSKLIVCGALHIPGIADRFRRRGDEVVTRDLTKEPWCVLPFERILRGEL